MKNTLTPRSQRGVTLVELIMFIVIAAIVAVAMVQTFSSTMRGSHLGKEMTQATQLAQQRMEVILGQRKRLGYTGFNATTFDPCDATGPVWGAQACSTTTYGSGNFTVDSSTSSFASDACGVGTGTNCRLIIVTVTSPTDGNVLTQLTAQVWNY